MEINNPKLKQEPTQFGLQKDNDRTVEISTPKKKEGQPVIDRETAEEIDTKFGHLGEPII